ncbi:DNA glycosylase [Mytilinidion resinicola]|uniref:DNA glycosylase n=1 Tax=Mytilinidion resinicola TaxID=574789 RepID=A0A6A6YMC1_9PEZI|nr:DNA glycosylase [Mytilinidion resinicola]KAF2810022.1 DNA glycosylase [Mytilinidion resinicola]
MASRATRASKAAGTASSQPLSTTVKPEPQQLSSPPPTPAPPKKRGARNGASTESGPITPKSTRKRTRTVVKKEEDINELPHNLGAVGGTLSDAVPQTPRLPPAKRRKSAKAQKDDAEIEENVESLSAKVLSTGTPSTSPKKKNNSYGLVPGQSPYPNWPHPTAEECHEVSRLLSSIHGKVKPPATIPIPSLTVSGCGEVPSVLDALIRTRLSAATSGTNSSRAFAGLVSRFGILQEGVGKGSVDWDAVRRADVKDIFEAIKSGGLADVKSKDIKAILQMVWEENEARATSLTDSSAGPAGVEKEAREEKDVEVARAEESVLSLDHLHLFSTDDAFNALTKYPGIGPKTASCVLLFCLQRPSFAVDTHVFRLCKWLGWVPPPGDPAGLGPAIDEVEGKKKKKGVFAGPTRNSTYAHLEVRIPDDLKYPLHQLFIKHGKTCPRCRAITGESSVGWEEGCVIDHLVTRSGGRKEGAGSLVKGKKASLTPKRKSKKAVESDEESSDLSDLGSDGEESEFEGYVQSTGRLRGNMNCYLGTT